LAPNKIRSTAALRLLPSAPKGAIDIDKQRGHEWPLFDVSAREA